MGALDIAELSVLYSLVLTCLQGTSILMGRTYTSPVRTQHHVW